MAEIDIVMGFRGVPEYRTEGYFEKAVESLELSTPINHRWIFVDDNSDEVGQRCVDSVASRFPDSIVIRTQRQNWFTRAHNKGLRLVRTPRALILNSDTEYGEGWLEEMIEVWTEVEQQTGKPVGLVGSELNPGVPHRWWNVIVPGYATMHAVLVDMAKCFDVAEKRGTPGEIFDITSPRTIHIHSDVELSHKMIEAGYQAVVSYRSAVGHHGGRSWGHLLGTIPGSLDAVTGL